MKPDKTWSYSGPIKDENGRTLETHWGAIVIAPSRSKALARLKYKYRQACGKHIRLDLPGELVMEGSE